MYQSLYGSCNTFCNSEASALFDRWDARLVCDPDDSLTADLTVEGSLLHTEIRITIWGAVGSIDPAIDAAQIALDAYAEAIAQQGRRAA
jgi:hypothetical protein